MNFTKCIDINHVRDSIQNYHRWVSYRLGQAKLPGQILPCPITIRACV